MGCSPQSVVRSPHSTVRTGFIVPRTPDLSHAFSRRSVSLFSDSTNPVHMNLECLASRYYFAGDTLGRSGSYRSAAMSISRPDNQVPTLLLRESDPPLVNDESMLPGLHAEPSEYLCVQESLLLVQPHTAVEMSSRKRTCTVYLWKPTEPV
jgi:hypothetical protein